MRRTFWLLGILLLLVGATLAIVLTNRERSRTTVVGADRAFKVPEAERVGKIFLADRRGNTTTLTRSPKGWTYNGTYPARPDAIDNLLDAVTRIEMAYKPANAAVPTLINSLSSEGIKVEIYDRRERLIKSYYVGGAPPDEYGTYVLLEGYEQPYVASIPGFTGNLRYRYNLVGDEWRDRTLFGVPPEEVRSVQIDYPKQRSQSFRLDRRGRGWTVRPLYEATPAIQSPLRPGAVDAFLIPFETLQITRYANREQGRQEVSRELPFADIRVELQNAEVRGVRLYPRWLIPVPPPELNLEEVEADLDGFFGLTTNDDFVLIQNQVISEILWPYSRFFGEKDAAQ